MSEIITVTIRFLSKTREARLAVCLMVLILAGSGAAWAGDRLAGTVVLDPGHGGHDRGAAGVDGTLEKDINLALARMVRDCLEGAYRVMLTRTGDYRLAPADRTATANHADADLFVSIHMAGDFSHVSEGITISSLEGAPSPTEKRSVNVRPRVCWNTAQIAHLDASGSLAVLIQESISDILHRQSFVQKARIAVLQGARMPAVLVEAGYITNPAREQQFRETDSLAAIADCLCTAIDRFFKSRSGP
ncbi:MAG: N-acetylmuramoyl-L-alanine amidase [Thermodesulfobacteriota bacterium]|nr:N-acetylmuramoyl-L-alanine amidase [Thermodesulfobacteriota bacterium]